MFKRMLWIPSYPVLREHPSFAGGGMVDSLLATPEIYAAFAAMPFLSLEEAAFLLLGYRPYQWEGFDVEDALPDYNRLLSCLAQSAYCGAIDPSPTLSAVQAWAEELGLTVPTEMAQEIARYRLNPEPPQPVSAGPSARTESPTAGRKETDHDPELQAAADEIVRECRAKGERVPKQIVIAERIRERRKLSIAASTIARRIRKTAGI